MHRLREHIDRIVILHPNDELRLYRKAQFEMLHGDNKLAQSILERLIELKYAKASALLLKLKFGSRDLGKLNTVEN